MRDGARNRGPRWGRWGHPSADRRRTAYVARGLAVETASHRRALRDGAAHAPRAGAGGSGRRP